jgi:hypothetical protein
MKTSKTFDRIHISVGGVVSVLAFYFLGREMTLGWIFQSLAGVLYTLYFWRQKLPIMATVILGSEAILPLYGLYKWSRRFGTFTTIDGVILGLTTLFVFYVGFRIYKTRSNSFLLTSVEFANALLYILATLILSITQSVVAWWVFLLVFILTLILVYIRKEWIAVGFQVAYIALGIFAILN